MVAPRIKKYVCTEEGCGKAYNRPALLRQHQRTHTNERPFVCPEEGCDMAFFRKSHLEVHQLSHLSDEEKPHKCPVCGKGFTSPQKLLRHVVTHTKSFRCSHEGCNKAFYAWQSLRHHEEITHQQALTCEHCNRAFSTRPLLLKHKLRDHGEVAPFMCDHPGCFRVFKSASSLGAHVKKAHPELECSKCGKKCIGSDALETHMLTHIEAVNPALWVCEVCPHQVQYITRNELINHYKEFHDNAIPPHLLQPAEELVSDPASRMFDSHSLQSMMRNTDLQPHIVEEDAEATDKYTPRIKRRRRNATEDPAIPCPENEAIINFIITLNQKTYTCPQRNCRKKYVRPKAFRNHIMRHKLEVQRATEILQRMEEEENIFNQNAVAQLESDIDASSNDRFTDVSDIEDYEDLVTEPSEATPSLKGEEV